MSCRQASHLANWLSSWLAYWQIDEQGRYLNKNILQINIQKLSLKCIKFLTIGDFPNWLRKSWEEIS